jgi:hypothetical protein
MMLSSPNDLVRLSLDRRAKSHKIIRDREFTAMRQAEGTAKLMGNNVIATIMRKTDDRLADQFHIVVRSSTIPDDKTIAVSQEDYEHLYPGMLVTVFKVGWGPLSAWWLRR